MLNATMATNRECRREQIANASEPCQEGHDGHGVEPGKAAARVHRPAPSHSTDVMTTMKGQVQSGRKMNVRRAAEETKVSSGRNPR